MTSHYLNPAILLKEFIVDKIIKPLRSKKKEKRLSGNIDASLFAYLTPLMFIIGTIVIVIIISTSHTLSLYFQTNVALNGLIIFLLSFSLFKTFHNNYVLYKTALFFKKIETIIQHKAIEENDVKTLQTKLENDIPLLNTKQMQGSIQNLVTFGHPNFSDKDAIIIKSKLGQRVQRMRADVGFNAGILVMLGLLGTFLGLLKTIDAVGDAMAGMSNLGGDGGEISAETMSSFISSLSAPLQGMGLAFSSSLFGLSGSLLIGFFNHLSGNAQDSFIEAASRWIDNRIPKFNPDKKSDGQQNPAATKDDLQTWLAGYVNLSIKTNKEIAHLTEAIWQSVKQTDHVNTALSQIADSQSHITKQFENTLQTMGHFKTQHRELIQSSLHCVQALQDLKTISATNLSEMNGHIQHMGETLANTLQNGLEHSNTTMHLTLQHVSDDLKQLHSVTTQEGQVLNTTLKETLTSYHETAQNALQTLHTDLTVITTAIQDQTALNALNQQTQTTKEIQTLLTKIEQDYTKTSQKQLSLLEKLPVHLKKATQQSSQGGLFQGLFAPKPNQNQNQNQNQNKHDGKQ